MHKGAGDIFELAVIIRALLKWNNEKNYTGG